MTNRPLDWEAIHTVTEVATRGTVRGAAKALGVHHTTVSRRIEQLETAIGARLFDRHPEGYAIRQEGEALVRVGRRFADELIDARRTVAGSDAALVGSLTVTLAEPLFAEVLAPRLPEFANVYPDVRLDFVMGFDFLDMARLEADVAVRMDNNPPETLVGKRLFAYRQTAYATPGYLRARDLSAQRGGAHWLGWTPDAEPHPDWVRDTEFPRLPVCRCFSTIGAQRAVATAGLGPAMLPCLFGDDDKRLVRAGSRPPIRRRDIWLLAHADLRAGELNLCLHGHRHSRSSIPS